MRASVCVRMRVRVFLNEPGTDTLCALFHPPAHPEAAVSRGLSAAEMCRTEHGG